MRDTFSYNVPTLEEWSVKAEASLWCLLNLYDTNEMSPDEYFSWMFDVAYWRQEVATCQIKLGKTR